MASVPARLDCVDRV